MALVQHARIVILAALPQNILAHSWVACTDYRGDVNYFQQDKCVAWPRQWWNRGPHTAPQPKGYHIAEEPPSRAWQGLGCDVAVAAPHWQDGYSEEFPFATYEAGRVYCLAWPMKNHGVLPVGCQEQQSKSDEGQDESLALLVSAVDPEADPTQAELDRRNINELAGLAHNCSSGGPSDQCQLGLERHRTGEADCKGFARAPKFCESSGAAMGTGCFKVPEDLVPGHYVAQWRWDASFPRAGGTQHSTYTSCFDFHAVPRGAAGARRGQPGTVGAPDSDLPCQNNVLRFAGDAATAAPLTATRAPVAPASPTGAARTASAEPPSTPAPAPAAPGSGKQCAGPYEICASPDRATARCCSAGHQCVHANEHWASCLPGGAATEAAAGRVPTAPPTPAPACVAAYEICAGPGWGGPRCCGEGYRCEHANEHWASCRPLPALAAVSARQSVHVGEAPQARWGRSPGSPRSLRAKGHASSAEAGLKLGGPADSAVSGGQA